MPDNKNMQFIFADRELILTVANLLTSPVDVIVNPANVNLSHGGGVAAQISQQGGDVIQAESDLFIKEHGELESGMVAFTCAGDLAYQAIIHAVGPRMGEGDEQYKIQQAVARSLQLCEMHDWQSVAFPAISTGIFSVPTEISARAFYQAITSFWDARMEGCPNKIIICLSENKFKIFLDTFQSLARVDDGVAEESDTSNNKATIEVPMQTGVVELSEQSISELENDDEVNDWFK